MKLKFTLLLILFSLLKIDAQGLVCKASEENQKVYSANPDALLEKKQFDIFTKAFEQQFKNEKSINETTYIIPVVFHVYGNTQSGKSVTYQKIVNHLSHLNDDFNGRNEDYETVEPFFKSRRDRLNIEFRLAKLTPAGACTTGVVFHPAKNGYGNGSGYDTQIAADASL